MTETTALITLNHPFHVARGNDRQAAAGARGEAGAGWRGAGARRGDLQARPGRAERCTARKDEWLATGDLAETEASGELRFLGRKSEVIVTAPGVNMHPEDLEAAIEEQAGRGGLRGGGDGDAAGPEPCAVLAVRGDAATGGGGHRARQRAAGGVPAVAALGAVAGAGPAAHFDRQGEAQGGGGVAAESSGSGQAATDGKNGHRRVRGVAGLAADADCRRSPAKLPGRGRRTAPDRGSAPRQPGPRATGGGA